MSPSNTIIPWPLPGSLQTAQQLWGSSGCPGVHQLLVSELVGLALALPFSVALLSIWDPLPLSFHLQTCPCRVGDGGLPLKFKKRPPLHSPPTPPFLLGVPRPGKGQKGEEESGCAGGPQFQSQAAGLSRSIAQFVFLFNNMTAKFYSHLGTSAHS